MRLHEVESAAPIAPVISNNQDIRLTADIEFMIQSFLLAIGKRVYPDLIYTFFYRPVVFVLCNMMYIEKQAL
jgi:hypothetical protein